MDMFDSRMFLYRLMAAIPILLICTPLHEFAHAKAADLLGDPTPRIQGRLTLNPIKHLDIVGSLMMIFAGIGWAKPVPVNISRFKNPKRDTVIVSLAGPLSNLLLAVISAAAIKVLSARVDNEIVASIMTQFVTINLCLFIFNLIPIPPLDGSRIVSSFLPNTFVQKISRYEKYFPIILFALVISGLLSRILLFFVDPLARLLMI